MKKFVVISAGSDSEGLWAHQTCPGLFDTPNAALAEFRKDWSRASRFELHQLETGAFQIIHQDDGRVDGLIVPIET